MKLLASKSMSNLAQIFESDAVQFPRTRAPKMFALHGKGMSLAGASDDAILEEAMRALAPKWIGKL